MFMNYFSADWSSDLFLFIERKLINPQSIMIFPAV